MGGFAGLAGFRGVFVAAGRGLTGGAAFAPALRRFSGADAFLAAGAFFSTVVFLTPVADFRSAFGLVFGFAFFFTATLAAVSTFGLAFFAGPLALDFGEVCFREGVEARDLDFFLTLPTDGAFLEPVFLGIVMSYSQCGAGPLAADAPGFAMPKA